jgi:hypothetical protein
LLAPLVERVIDEGATLQETLVVTFDLEPSLANRKESRSKWISSEFLRDICGMNDAGEPLEPGSRPRSKSSINTSKVH